MRVPLWNHKPSILVSIGVFGISGFVSFVAFRVAHFVLSEIRHCYFEYGMQVSASEGFGMVYAVKRQLC